MADITKCELCREKCPQAQMAHNAALGRMYATKEFITLQNKVENGQLVEVIHCRDCKHYDNPICEVHSEWPDQYSPGHTAYMEPDDFCSYGEPKGGQVQQR